MVGNLLTWHVPSPVPLAALSRCRRQHSANARDPRVFHLLRHLPPPTARIQSRGLRPGTRSRLPPALPFPSRAPAHHERFPAVALALSLEDGIVLPRRVHRRTAPAGSGAVVHTAAPAIGSSWKAGASGDRHLSASRLLTPRLLRKAAWSTKRHAHRLRSPHFDGQRWHSMVSRTYQRGTPRSGLPSPT